jgi:hypothetical protein
LRAYKATIGPSGFGTTFAAVKRAVLFHSAWVEDEIISLPTFIAARKKHGAHDPETNCQPRYVG